MRYQIIIDLLDNTPNQQSKVRPEKWVEINDDARMTPGGNDTNSQMKSQLMKVKK